jgi:hypothetical protein
MRLPPLSQLQHRLGISSSSSSIDLTSHHIRGVEYAFPCLQTLSLVRDNQVIFFKLS